MYNRGHFKNLAIFSRNFRRASLRAAQPRGNPVAAAGLLRYARNDEVIVGGR
jgi:hypothetical protein